MILGDSKQRIPPGDHPLAWWAVKRVTIFGRINLRLAAAFAFCNALYVVNQAHWPPWLGRQAFAMFDRMGGIPGLSTALVLLAAVPAAFQYGLWTATSRTAAGVWSCSC